MCLRSHHCSTYSSARLTAAIVRSAAQMLQHGMWVACVAKPAVLRGHVPHTQTGLDSLNTSAFHLLSLRRNSAQPAPIDATLRTAAEARKRGSCRNETKVMWMDVREHDGRFETLVDYVKQRMNRRAFARQALFGAASIAAAGAMTTDVSA